MQPSHEEIRALLGQVRSIAVVGAKDVPGQPVNAVGRYLIEAGFELFPVHPVRKDIWGLPTYKTIAELPKAVDCIDLFRAAEFCPGHAREALSLAHKPKIFWMQLGIESPEARAMLEKEGVAVVENACLMVEHRRFFPAP